MSRKTTQFRRKFAQFVRAGKSKDDVVAILPTARVRSKGRTTIYIGTDTTEPETGKTVKAGKRIPGRASNAIVTEPMGEEKLRRYSTWLVK
jgi:hypothetical protein